MRLPRELTKKEIGNFLVENFPKILREGKVTGIQMNASGMPDITFNLQIGTVRKQIFCEVKSVGEPRYLYQAIAQLRQILIQKKKRAYPIVVAPFISERGREICREAEVGYLDLCGNIYLKFDTVYIERTGSEKNLLPKRLPKRTVFSPKASRILRVLLENPKRQWTFTSLSQDAGVYIRQTWLVINNLYEQGFIEKQRGAISLIKPGELLDYWAQNYDLQKNQIQTFFSFARSFEEFLTALKKAANELKMFYALTLHSGASLVAPYVRFSDVHFYISGDVKPWVKKLDLRPAETGGTIHLISPYDEGVFYNKQEIDGAWVVGNIQLYLDLYKYPTRGREQADFLRRQKIGS